MLCPNCACEASRITQSKHDTIESKLRNRRCKDCNHDWWTVEVELPPETVKWVRTHKSPGSSVPVRIGAARQIGCITENPTRRQLSLALNIPEE